MSKAQRIRFYEERSATFSLELKQLNKRIRIVSNVRLLVALAFLASLYVAFQLPYLAIVAAALVVIFIYLVQRHAELFNAKTHTENLVTTNNIEANALNGKLDGLHNGAQFIDTQHPYAHDLDLFGEGSLFQYLNRCYTIGGRALLAKRLKESLSNDSAIHDHQQALQELSGKVEFRQHFQANAMSLKERPEDIKELLSWSTLPPFINTRGWLRIALIVLPLLTIAAVGVALIRPETKGIAILLVLSQWITAGIYLKKVNALHDYVSRKKNILYQFSQLLSHIEKERFTTAKLQKIVTDAHAASSEIKKLASLVNALDARANFLMVLLVNSTLLYDLQIVFRLEKWKQRNATSLHRWLRAIEETEMLNSFANYAYNNPAFAYAKITAELSIHGEAIAHPLLQEEERISNIFTLGKAPAIFIITGANMAGKSTFLRTVGVNLILALNGAPVCATAFSCPIIKLRTGMRTADSLKDHQSYFYAELNRLKTIMDELRSDTPLLILLDEILKGTNSTDKQAGSMALVKQLLPHPCLAMIATHDISLGELETTYPNAISNYCFEADIQQDQLSFDYKLKRGVAQKMNASFLMRKMGIIEG